MKRIILLLLLVSNISVQADLGIKKAVTGQVSSDYLWMYNNSFEGDTFYIVSGNDTDGWFVTDDYSSIKSETKIKRIRQYGAKSVVFEKYIGKRFDLIIDYIKNIAYAVRKK